MLGTDQNSATDIVDGRPEATSTEPRTSTTRQVAVVAASSSGFYRIRVRHTNASMETSFASVDDGASIIQSLNAGPNYLPSHWTLVPASPGVYTIVNRNSGKVWDVTGASADLDTPVVQFTPHGRGNQQFRLQEVELGWYLIRPMHAPNRVIEVAAGSQDNAAPLQQYDFDGGLYQQFRFDPI